MIKDNQKLLNRIHVLIDAVVTAISYLMAWYLKFATGFAETDPNVGVLDMYTYFRALYILVPLYLVLYYFFNLYAPKRATRRKYELFAIVKANTVGLILFMTLLYIINQLDISRFVLGAFYIINIILMTLCRTMIRNILYFFRRKGYNLKYILLVG